MRRTEAIGVATVTIPRDSRGNRKAREVELEVAYTRVTLKKPKRVVGDSPEKLDMNLLRISETGNGGDKIEWILATNTELGSAEDCMRIVGHYIRRWRIERFHFVLKSGYQVERIQQRTVAREAVSRIRGGALHRGTRQLQTRAERRRTRFEISLTRIVSSL